MTQRTAVDNDPTATTVFLETVIDGYCAQKRITMLACLTFVYDYYIILGGITLQHIAIMSMWCRVIISFLLHCTLASCGTVYCNRSYLWVWMWVWVLVGGWVGVGESEWVGLLPR